MTRRLRYMIDCFDQEQHIWDGTSNNSRIRATTLCGRRIVSAEMGLPSGFDPKAKNCHQCEAQLTRAILEEGL